MATERRFSQLLRDEILLAKNNWNLMTFVYSRSHRRAFSLVSPSHRSTRSPVISQIFLLVHHTRFVGSRRFLVLPQCS
jgi:hypothetical protein